MWTEEVKKAGTKRTSGFWRRDLELCVQSAQAQHHRYARDQQQHLPGWLIVHRVRMFPWFPWIQTTKTTRLSICKMLHPICQSLAGILHTWPRTMNPAPGHRKVGRVCAKGACAAANGNMSRSLRKGVTRRCGSFELESHVMKTKVWDCMGLLTTWGADLYQLNGASYASLQTDLVLLSSVFHPCILVSLCLPVVFFLPQ